MGLTMNTHKITKDECLSLIALKYNTTVEKLQELNSDQIQDIDYILEGNTLNIPDNTSSGERIPLPEKPTSTATGNTTCSAVQPKFVDVLYVPSHPISGKKTWYAITETARKAILKEKETLIENVVGVDSKKDKFSALDKLGVLSNFNTKPHEQFLDNDEDKEKYHQLIIDKMVLETGADDYYDGGREAFIKSLASTYNLSFDDELKHVNIHDKANIGIELANSNNYGLEKADSLYDEYQSLAQQSERRKKALSNLRSNLLKSIEKKINVLKGKAESNAQHILSDDGTSFVFDKNSHFFTSQKQIDIANTIKAFNQNRPCDENDLISFSQDKLNEYYSNGIRNALTPRKLPDSTATIPTAFARHLEKLNSLGFVVIEQCLSQSHLIGTDVSHFGPKALVGKKGDTSWREISFWSWSSEPTPLNVKQEQTIQRLYNELCPGKAAAKDIVNEANVCDWAYYPTLGLINLIDVSLKSLKDDLNALLGAGNTAPVNEVIKQLLWIKQVAIARKELLLSIANKNAQSKTSLHFLSDNITGVTFTLIDDEKEHKVKEKKLGRFINKAGTNDIQIVECCLMSDGNLFWIRGPHWYLPSNKDDKTCAGHIQELNVEIEAPSANNHVEETGTDLTTALDEMKKGGEIDLTLSAKIAKFTSTSEFWSDGYHYKEGLAPDGAQCAYNADAQAQFMRFTSDAATKFHTFDDKLTGFEFSNTFGSEIEIKGELQFFNTQLNFSTWLPLNDENAKVKSNKPSQQNKIRGYDIKIPYMKTGSTEVQSYHVGLIAINLSAQVYGLAAATCQLGTGITFGPSEDNGGIGIRGSSVNVPSYNLVDGQSATSKVIGGQRALSAVAAEAKSKVDMFVGVEAGGAVSAEFYWQPPLVSSAIGASSKPNNPNSYLTLGKISAKASVSYGLGASAELRLTYQHGEFIIIAAAQFVAGPGCSGKVAIELNPENADRFINCCLAVLKESGFRRIALFGESDSNGVNEDFVAFNNVLTVAITLGLTFAEAMLLPDKAVRYYKQETLKGEYAPFLAQRITEEENKVNMQTWITSIPPETLSSLLNCLISVQYKIAENTIQINAILQILQWLTNNTSGVNQNQFERALVLMNGDIETQQAPSTQWESFKVSWRKLALFIKKYGDNKKEDEYEFNKNCAELCKNMTLYKVITSNPAFTMTDYICFYNGDDLDAHTKEIRDQLKDKLRTQQYTSIEWKTDAI